LAGTVLAKSSSLWISSFEKWQEKRCDKPASQRSFKKSCRLVELRTAQHVLRFSSYLCGLIMSKAAFAQATDSSREQAQAVQSVSDALPSPYQASETSNNHPKQTEIWA